MTPIRCQDTVFLTTDFDDCVRELRAHHATFQAPLRCTCRPPASRVGVPQVRAHDLVVEFDETRTRRAAVVSTLAKYGCRERPQGGDTPPVGPLPSNATVGRGRVLPPLRQRVTVRL
jgi:hypothetical protein